MILHAYDLDEDCYRVRLAASCLGIALTVEPVNAYPRREHRTPAMLALNPRGRLPILRDADLVLCETGAILLHLSKAAGGALVPEGAAGAGMMDWLFFAARDLRAATDARAVAMMDAPGDLGALRTEARAALRVMDDHMSRQAIRGHGFVVGPTPSLADLALFPAFALSRDFNVDHDEFPALRSWVRRVRQLPGFITMPGIPDYH